MRSLDMQLITRQSEKCTFRKRVDKMDIGSTRRVYAGKWVGRDGPSKILRVPSRGFGAGAANL